LDEGSAAVPQAASGATASHHVEGRHGHSHSRGAEPASPPVDHERSSAKRRESDGKAIRQLSWAIVLCFVFMIAEVVGGYFSGSIAIMTDAAHLFSDVASLVIGVFAMCVAQRAPSPRMTFGYRRLEVFGALISVLIVWVLVVVLVYEAIRRFSVSGAFARGSFRRSFSRTEP
jgi:Co/Zn/Cd efflux system component